MLTDPVVQSAMLHMQTDVGPGGQNEAVMWLQHLHQRLLLSLETFQPRLPARLSRPLNKTPNQTLRNDLV